MPSGVYPRRKKSRSKKKKSEVEYGIVEVLPEIHEEDKIIEVIPVIYVGDPPPMDYKNLGHWGNVTKLVIDGDSWKWICKHCEHREANSILVTETVDWFHTNKGVLKAVACKLCGRRYVFPGQVFDRFLEELIGEQDEV